jgi:hypothetical protein
MSSSASSNSSLNAVKGTIHDPEMYSKRWFDARIAKLEAFYKSDPKRTATLEEFQVFMGDSIAAIDSKGIGQPPNMNKK